MVEIKEYIKRDWTEEPDEITIDEVMYWSRHTKELNSTQVRKALTFLKYDCIRYLGEPFERLPEFRKLKEKYPDARHIFVCLPLNTKPYHDFLGIRLFKEPYIQDYNFSEYIIYKNKEGNFECNCQGYQSKKKKGELIPGGANCSHILALYYAFKIKRFGKNQGAEDENSIRKMLIAGDKEWKKKN